MQIHHTQKRAESRTFTGAWIETGGETVSRWNNASRTFTGAWIETLFNLEAFGKDRVAPSRVRGLKHLWRNAAQQRLGVAPSRVRGLKP